MPFETINMEEITEARRKAIAGSIRTISAEELIEGIHAASIRFACST